MRSFLIVKDVAYALFLCDGAHGALVAATRWFSWPDGTSKQLCEDCAIPTRALLGPLALERVIAHEASILGLCGSCLKSTRRLEMSVNPATLLKSEKVNRWMLESMFEAEQHPHRKGAAKLKMAIESFQRKLEAHGVAKEDVYNDETVALVTANINTIITAFNECNTRAEAVLGGK